eukprot:m.65186 g.65186  ORF g.65186 m.65186 type:complete len:223 (+) comp12586_c0_seq1:83-751(+)
MTKKIGFEVKIEIIELLFAPFTSGQYFAKIKQGSQVFLTKRQEIRNNTVQWNETYTFDCAIPLNKNDLTNHELAISLRKDKKGGSDYEKLGKRVINLSEFAMKGDHVEVNLVLNSTTTNATFHLVVSMRQTSGGPIYGAPPFSKGIVRLGSAADAAGAAMPPPSPSSLKLRTISSLGSLSSRDSARDSWVVVGRLNPDDMGSRDVLSPAAPTPLPSSVVAPL